MIPNKYFMSRPQNSECYAPAGGSPNCSMVSVLRLFFLTAIIIIAIHLVVNSNDAHQLSPPFSLREVEYCLYSLPNVCTVCIPM